MLKNISRARYISAISCLLAGAVTPLSFAPFHLWPVGLCSLAIFGALLAQAPRAKTALLLAIIFGIGYFGTGVSWVYVSIYYFGSTSWLLAVLLTSLFITFVACVFALPFTVLPYCKPQMRLLLGFPLLWVISEWLRTWLLTGFPWLFVGYSHIDTPLIGWAPIGGVLFISLISVATSSALALLFISIKNHQQAKKNTDTAPSETTVNCSPYSLIGILIVVLSLWIGGYGLQFVSWTKPLTDSVSVGLVQPNIPQQLRWAPHYQETIRERLRTLSEPLWGNDWIIWSEAAIPAPYSYATDFINEIRRQAEESDTVVISGVLYEKPIDNRSPQKGQQYFNSVIGLGDSEGIYHKQRLVPFGEYVPLESWLRGLIEFFNLPFSVITAGASEQKPLQVGKYLLANAICYEIAYPALVAAQAKNSHALLTISNDAWFGDSIGPLQHFEMARMRAVEIGRYVVRGTNNGVSAIIDAKGEVMQESRQFVMTQLQGSITPMEGNTPFMVLGNWLVLGVLGMMTIVAFSMRRLSSSLSLRSLAKKP